MSDWSNGYVTDVAYTHSFFAEMTPTSLGLALAMQGQTPPRGDRGRYLELGAGNGLTASIIAATTPGMEVVATDFMPSHAVAMQNVIDRAGLTNCTVREEAFAETAARDIGPFDFIALHGIYSWVSDENRMAIREIIKRSLRPGGVVYLSYNCMPGWAPLSPIRELLRMMAAHETGDSSQRLKKAIAKVNAMNASGARYFRQSESILHQLKTISNQPTNYLAHEYLNADWRSFWFSEVSAELSEAKLTYAGSAALIDSLEDLNYDQKTAKALKAVEDPILRQNARDVWLNQRFRRDVFMRGANPMSQPSRNRYIDGLRFVAMQSPDHMPETHTVPRGKMPLNPDLYGPILAAVAKRPMTLTELARDPSLAAHDTRIVHQAATVMAGIGLIAPCQVGETSERVSESTTRLNRVLMEDVVDGRDRQFLASPITGAAVRIKPLNQLFCYAELNKKDPTIFARTTMASLGQSLAKDGKAVPPNQVEPELRTRYDDYTTNVKPALKRLGVL